MMPDIGANDIADWQTTLVGRGVDAAARRLLSARFTLLSPGVVALPEAHLGFRQSLMVRDPDGHARQLIASSRQLDVMRTARGTAAL